MTEALKSVEHIVDLCPLILLNRSKSPFVFGDAPVVFYNNYQMNVELSGVLGLQTPGLQIFYPLSSRESLLLLDRIVYRVRGVDNWAVNVENSADIDQLNKLQIYNAYDAVYFSDFNDADYVKKLWLKEKENIILNSDKLIEAPGFDRDGNPLGDIVHVYEPLLPFRLQLDFIDHDIVDDENCKFSRKQE